MNQDDFVNGIHDSTAEKRYDVLDNNDDVLESFDSWTLASIRAKEHGFRVRDNMELTFGDVNPIKEMNSWDADEDLDSLWDSYQDDPEPRNYGHHDEDYFQSYRPGGNQ